MDQLPRIIGLGARYARIAVDLHEVYAEQHHRPILKSVRDEVIARHVTSPGSVILGQLRDKGVLYTEDAGTEIDVSCCMEMDVILARTQRGHSGDDWVVVWPLEHKGKTVAQVKQAIGSSDPPDEPEPEAGAQAPASLDSETQGVRAVPANTEPIKLVGQKLAFYQELLKVYRERSGAPMRAIELGEVSASLNIKSAPAIVRELEKLGLMVITGGIKYSKSDPTMRVIVFHPFEDEKGELTIPPECLPASADEVFDDEGEEEEAGDAEQGNEAASPHCQIHALSDETEPIVLVTRQLDGYEALLRFARSVGYVPMSPAQIKEVISSTGAKSPHSVLFNLDRKELCRKIGGSPSDPKNFTQRVVVFRPYRRGMDGVIVVPEECESQSAPAPESTESTEEPEESTATGRRRLPAGRQVRSRDDLQEMLEQAQAALERLKEEACAQRLKPLQDEIAALDQEEEQLRARLAEIGAERDSKAGDLQSLRAELDESLEPEGSEAATLQARIDAIRSAIHAYDLIVVDE